MTPLPVVTRAVASESAPSAPAEVSASARADHVRHQGLHQDVATGDGAAADGRVGGPDGVPRRAFTSVSALPAKPPMSAVELGVGVDVGPAASTVARSPAFTVPELVVTVFQSAYAEVSPNEPPMKPPWSVEENTEGRTSLKALTMTLSVAVTVVLPWR